MTATIIALIEWWLGLFGISDPAYVKLGVTLTACACLLMVLYVAAALVIAIFATIVEAGTRK